MYPVENTASKVRKWSIIIGGILILLVIGFFVMVMIRKEPGETVGQGAKNLFPFKNKLVNGVRPNQTITPDEIEPIPTDPEQPLPDIVSTQKIRQITDFPISGFKSETNYITETKNIYDEKLAKQIVTEEKIPLDTIYFTRRDNGFLYHGEVTSETIIQKQITQTIVPGVYETIILSSPLRLIYRYAVDDTIQSFFASIPENEKFIEQNTNYCSSDFSRDLKIRDRGNDVLTVQTIMNEKLGTKIKQDGIFGKQTLATMKQFQEFLAVPITGIYDQLTRDALFKICTEYKKSQAEAVKALEKTKNEPKEIKGKLLEKNIIDIVTDPSNTLFASFLRTRDSFMSASITDTKNNTRKIFSSTFSEWRPQWINNNLAVLTTKASGSADGYAYGLNLTSGGIRKLMGPYGGLVTNTSPDGRKILYSENTSNDTGMSLWVKTIGRDTDKRMTQDTLAEKCTWSPDSVMVYCMIPDSIPSGNYPDDWYMGTSWFNDTLWQFNLTDGISTQIGIFPEEIDGYKLSVSPSGKYVYVVNRLNDNLWVVNLEK
jgi:peptidoglycan hydrolase-like protein with peptidoglycan-binding domain